MVRSSGKERPSWKSTEPKGQVQTDLRQARRGELERDIVQVATEAFARRGYASPTLREITKEAGVSLPVVYWFFADKRHLYVECCKRLLKEEVDIMSGAVDGCKDDESTIVAFVESVVRNHSERYASRLFHRVMLDDDQPLLQELKDILFTASFFNRVIAAISKISPEDDPELRLLSLISFTAGFMEHVRFWSASGRDVIDPASSIDVARHILSSSIAGIAWETAIRRHFGKPVKKRA